MMKVFPFKGVHYNLEKFKDLTPLITPPYDQINTKEDIQKYYDRHPYNICRIIKNMPTENDTPQNNVYTRANQFFKKWMKEGVLVQEEEEALYVYDQVYKHPETGEELIRTGFIGAGQLYSFDENVVLPHERTLSGPKKDRLELTRATNASFGLIFMIYLDEERKVDSVLNEVKKREPDMKATDDFGVLHRVWILKDKDKISAIQKAMADKQVIIADGHHRYETALTYRNEMREKTGLKDGNQPFDRTMMAFYNASGKGMTVLPFHRAVHSVPNLDHGDLFTKLSYDFVVKEVYPEVKDEKEKVRKLIEGVKYLGKEFPTLKTFGMYSKKQKSAYLLIYKETGTLEALAPDHSKEWRDLAVTSLHTLILEPILGIDNKKLERKMNLSYPKTYGDVVKLLEDEKYQLFFFLNPVTPEQLVNVARNGERLFQKSTNFYPKLYTGFTIYYIGG